jgi:hypothetical protein
MLKNLSTSFNAHTLKASADGSIVITLPRLTLTILHAQSIRSALNLLNKRTANRLNKRIYSHEASEARSIVCTIAAGIVRTIIQIRRRLNRLDNRRILCLDKRIRFQTGSTVSTVPQRPAETILQPQSSLITALHTNKRKQLEQLTREPIIL